MGNNSSKILESVETYIVGYDHLINMAETEKSLVLLNRAVNYTMKGITHIFPQREFTIYTDEQYENYWYTDNNYIFTFKTGTLNANLKRISCFTNKPYIKINKICRNWTDKNGTFWISDEHKVYFTSTPFKKDLYYPINELFKCYISDIHIGHQNVYALRDDADWLRVIINYWDRKYYRKSEIAMDVINLIMLYYQRTRVYTSSFGSANYIHMGRLAVFPFIHKKHAWSLVNRFEYTNIIQITSGKNGCFFLDANGNIYKENGSFGAKLNIFAGNRIIIDRIDSGMQHGLALDANHNVWSWGNNIRGQCGHDRTNTANSNNPFEMITPLKHVNVVEIKCGGFHSYVKGSDDKHYLFGDDTYSQCSLEENDNIDKVNKPYCINDKFRRLTQKINIDNVILGIHCTILIIKAKSKRHQTQTRCIKRFTIGKTIKATTNDELAIPDGEYYQNHYNKLTDNKIKQLFFSTVDRTKYKITDIEDAMIPKQKRLYELNLWDKCDELQKSRDKIEKYLWYGSSYDTMRVIEQNGFDRSYSSVAVCGSGTYFARDAKYSVNNDYCPTHSDGYQYILLCKVIVGDSTRGSSSMKKVPLKANKKEYDTLVNDINDPTIYFVWRNYTAIPVYRVQLEAV